MTQEQINKQIFRRLEKIEHTVFVPKTKKSNMRKVKTTKIDFNISKRAFIKNYGEGLSGPKKFVLMLAYLTKGKIGDEKSIEEIKNNWNKMTSLFECEYNSYYSITAKDNNWADSKKYGIWFLVKDWEKIFF